jgi:transcriptional regulator with XRE-family HTH domain
MIHMRESIDISNEPTVPQRRFLLCAEIIRAEFRNYSQFSRRIGIDPAYISKVLNGFIFPSAKVQRLMADQLGLSLRELRKLL